MKGQHQVEKNKRADAADVHKKPKGIPCPKCGGCKWSTRNTRRMQVKIVRVRVCTGTPDAPGCGHRIRTRETVESISAA